MTTTLVSTVIAPGDPQPRTYIGGGGAMPVISFGETDVLLQPGEWGAAYLREFAASLLHLAGLTESAELDRSMAAVCALDPSRGRAS